MVSISSIVRGLVIMTTSVACHSGPTIYDGAEAARARVSGAVTTPSGAALDQVLVTVHLPSTIYERGYAYASATTDADGRFTADVIRLFGVPAIAVPDTITAFVVATASGPKYLSGAGGKYPTDSVRVLVQFYNAGQTPVPSVARVQLAIP